MNPKPWDLQLRSGAAQALCKGFRPPLFHAHSSASCKKAVSPASPWSTSGPHGHCGGCVQFIFAALHVLQNLLERTTNAPSSTRVRPQAPGPHWLLCYPAQKHVV